MSLPPGLAGWLALHFALAFAGTWLARRYALGRRLVDEPGERRSHHVATPRGGGIAIVLALLVALAALMARAPQWVPSLGLAVAGLILVAGIGWVDDHRPLSPWLRLIVHALAAALLGLACIVAGGGLAQALAAVALALVLVNVWNFMDGIDGLAASQAALVAAAFGVIASPTGAAWWLGWALVAASLGFLPFNFPRARIFLGDVGSGALGYALAALAGLAFRGDAAQVWILLPLSAFLVDAALTLSARMVRGERWWTPHVQHLYQRLARRWGGHRKVTLVYAAWTLTSIALMWFVHLRDAATIMFAVCAWYLTGVGIWAWSKRGVPRNGVATE